MFVHTGTRIGGGLRLGGFWSDVGVWLGVKQPLTPAAPVWGPPAPQTEAKMRTWTVADLEEAIAQRATAERAAGVKPPLVATVPAPPTAAKTTLPSAPASLFALPAPGKQDELAWLLPAALGVSALVLLVVVAQR